MRKRKRRRRMGGWKEEQKEMKEGKRERYGGTGYCKSLTAAE